MTTKPMLFHPQVAWETQTPTAAGFDPAKLANAKQWLEEHAGPNGRYRVVIVRGGRPVATWYRGVEPDEHLRLASAAKSIFSCILALAIAEGKIVSADDQVVDYYPEMMDVPEGAGPKPGRYAFPDNRAITFRQLISNTSGYMKPGEAPGQVFNYQTFGMNILTHAIASVYGFYDSRNPEGSPGLKPLIERWIGEPIGAQFRYYKANFDLPAAARIHIFGYYDGVSATALDMARLGWLWRHWGKWGDQQVIPATWLREATQVAPDIRANSPPADWQYGYGFWTNQEGRLWPDLPRDSFAAAGAGSQHIWVCPSLDLVVVQSPGLWQDQAENNHGLLRLVVEALSKT